MAFADGQRGHDLGLRRPARAAAIASRASSGEVELEMELAPRPEYGLVMPLFRLEEGGARTFGAGRIAVRSAVPLEVDGATMRATFTVAEGEQPRLLDALGVRRATGARPSRRAPDARRRRGSPTRPRAGAPGRPSTTSTRARTGSSSASARACSRASPTAPPARSSPRRPPRCPRPSAASATGTTASPGSATRA